VGRRSCDQGGVWVLFPTLLRLIATAE